MGKIKTLAIDVKTGKTTCECGETMTLNPLNNRLECSVCKVYIDLIDVESLLNRGVSS